jgi:hypothetical protein
MWLHIRREYVSLYLLGYGFLLLLEFKAIPNVHIKVNTFHVNCTLLIPLGFEKFLHFQFSLQGNMPISLSGNRSGGNGQWPQQGDIITGICERCSYQVRDHVSVRGANTYVVLSDTYAK